jgi:hypothetical protein
MVDPSKHRIHTVLAILSITPSFKSRDIKARIANLPQFQSLTGKFQSHRPSKQISKRLPEITRVCQLFTDNPFTFPCNFSLLELISNCHITDPILNELFVLTALHSYIAFMIRYEAIDVHDGLPQLFLALSSKNGGGFQSICVAALSDILNVIGQVWSSVPFDSLFPYVHDYFYSGQAPDGHYMFLPQFLHVLISVDSFSGTGGAAKLSGLIEILLQQHRPFSQPAIDFLYSVIHPFNYQLNFHALTIMKVLRIHLKPEAITSFVGDLPILLAQVIEQGTPLLCVTALEKVETFEPAVGPENFFRFASVTTFCDGCDPTKPLNLPEPDQNLLCPPSLVDLVNVLIRLFGTDVDLF